jgi:excisionase family DNA binding protein
MTDNVNHTDWITTSEAAELTGYSPHYVRRLMRKNRVLAKKWGNTWMINKQSLLDYKQRMDELGRARHNPRQEK